MTCTEMTWQELLRDESNDGCSELHRPEIVGMSVASDGEEVSVTGTVATEEQISLRSKTESEALRCKGRGGSIRGTRYWRSTRLWAHNGQ